jgi:hypothetical protein
MKNIRKHYEIHFGVLLPKFYENLTQIDNPKCVYVTVLQKKNYVVFPINKKICHL